MECVFNHVTLECVLCKRTVPDRVHISRIVTRIVLISPWGSKKCWSLVTYLPVKTLLQILVSYQPTSFSCPLMPNLHYKVGTEALLIWHLCVFTQTA